MERAASRIPPSCLYSLVGLLPPATDYTDRDFDALRARLIALLETVFPDWSDFDVAAFGNILLEMFAFVGDVLGYYGDNHARESRLVTATQRRSVIALAQMFGYRLGGARAAVTDVELALDAIPLADVSIPGGTTVRTEEVTEPIRFQLLADALIATGADPPVVTVPAEHSQSHERLFTATGRADQEQVLPRTPYLDGSAEVSASNGAYLEMPSLLGSGPGDRHFVVRVDQNDRATLRFGDGTNGAPPTGTLRVRYKTGGGSAGRVDAGRLRIVEGTFTDSSGRPVHVTAHNASRSEGGFDRETVAAAKVNVPESLRALTRSVAREDFEIHARKVPGVARALMLTSDDTRAIEENAGILFIVPTGGGALIPALQNAVLRQVTDVYPHTLTFQVSVQGAAYRRIDVYSRLFFAPGIQSIVERAKVAAEVRRRLAEHFQVTNPDGTPNRRVDFGFNVQDADGHPVGEVALSDIRNVVRDTPDVRKLGDLADDFRLSDRAADIRLRIEEFPVLGSVRIVDGDTGALY
ncbi:MAG: hypothetical protein SangKO_066960 [Sandaracinaceae bacterium]